MDYNLYSEFDIEKHSKCYINYLEVLIEENGHVLYAVPSHQERAIELAMQKLQCSRKEIDEKCPPEYYADFLRWILSITGSIAVWNNFYAGVINERQKEKLKELREKGIYRGEIDERKKKNRMTDIKNLNKAIITPEDECKRHDCCEDCPMLDYEKYKINKIGPSDWELIEDGEQE